MTTKIKLNLLNDIYIIYDEFIKKFKKACKIGCCNCCTCNVTITSLEALGVIDYLRENKRSVLPDFLKNKKYFKPNLTTNQVAELCIKGEDIPQEDNNPNWGVCPFLSDKICSIYQVRPFMCRAQISEHNCKKNGYSLIDPLILTANNLFLQYIEHIDFKGYFGNLADMLIILSKKDNLEKYLNESPVIASGAIIRNNKSKVLMIPPEHRIKVTPVLNKLNRVITK
jgi:Fe-S-cluster containining protein